MSHVLEFDPVELADLRCSMEREALNGNDTAHKMLRLLDALETPATHLEDSHKEAIGAALGFLDEDVEGLKEFVSDDFDFDTSSLISDVFDDHKDLVAQEDVKTLAELVFRAVNARLEKARKSFLSRLSAFEKRAKTVGTDLDAIPLE